MFRYERSTVRFLSPPSYAYPSHQPGRNPVWQREVAPGARFSNEGVAALADPALGPCRLQHLGLSGQLCPQDGVGHYLGFGV